MAVNTNANQGGGSDIPGYLTGAALVVSRFPANGGAASPPIYGVGQQGYVLTRYGGTSDNSEYFAPRGTTIEERNLLEGTNTDIYEEFKILKPFGLRQTQILGPDGLPTGGIQLESSMPAGQLLDEGFIEAIPQNAGFWERAWDTFLFQLGDE